MLPSLENAQPTIQNLHAVSRLLGTIRVLAFERQPNYLELGLKITPNGLSTDVLPTGGEIILDFRQLALVYKPAHEFATTIPISGGTQTTLLETLLATIHSRELAQIVPKIAGESYTASVFKAVDSLVNHLKPNREHVTDTTPLHFDVQRASEYANALYSIFTGVARFHARLSGSMTPVVVWPEHFDLSFLWFAAEPDEQHPHLNFGFAPYSAGIDYPYLYAYAHPYPADYLAPQLPSGARWNTAGWTGVVLPYAEIAKQSAPETYIETSCTAIFKALRPLLG